MRQIKLWVAIALITTVFACQNNKNTQLVFTTISVTDSIQNYTDDTTLSYVININFVETSDRQSGSTPLTNRINSDFFELFDMPFDDSEQTVENTLKSYMVLEFERFIHDVADAPTDCAACRSAEFTLTPKNQYQNNQISSLAYEWWQYSGGAAHGMYGMNVFNYDKNNETVIDLYNLSTDMNKITAIAESKFIEQNGDLENFTFTDGFYLPDTFYFTDDAIIFYYHPYDIASYADGAITLTLKNSDVKHLITYIE
ncbi:MAG: RsiV family protein [Prevotellaceae bacterium]|jgi:hypothetical protein|nr:RsiV family protein [Prevotellaceae bacterium]